MAKDVIFKDNSAAVLAQLRKNIGKTLHTIGLTFIELSSQEADRLIYDTPLPTPSPGWEWTAKFIERTGDYRRGLMYQVDVGGKTVYLGVDQSVHYAMWLERGTWKMSPRPIISNTIQNNMQVWQELIQDIMSEGFA